MLKRRVDEAGKGEVKQVEETVVNDAECGWFEHSAVAGKTPLSITISRAHAMCGHMGQVEARGVCEYFGQVISKQGFQKCVSCGKAKMKQKPLTQDNTQANSGHVVAGPEGHSVFVDVSSVKHGSDKKLFLSKPYWMLIVVEYSGFKISSFLSRKKDLPKQACETIRQVQKEGVEIKHVRMDNAGENLSFANLANGKEWNLRLTFELTGASTPQRNKLAEVGFGTLWSRLRATFDAAMVPEEEQYKLVREGMSHLTFLDGLIVKTINGQTMTRYGHVFGNEQKVVMPLHIWGEAGFVKIT